MCCEETRSSIEHLYTVLEYERAASSSSSKMLESLSFVFLGNYGAALLEPLSAQLVASINKDSLVRSFVRSFARSTT